MRFSFTKFSEFRFKRRNTIWVPHGLDCRDVCFQSYFWPNEAFHRLYWTTLVIGWKSINRILTAGVASNPISCTALITVIICASWKIKKLSNSTVAGYALQFPRKGTSDYVIITRGMPNLSAVTVCLWMKTADTRNEGTPLSYVVSGGREELLLYNYRNFRVFINNHHRFKYLIWSFVLLLITIVVLI